MTQVRADDLVVEDESSTNIHRTPRMARAPRGQRAYGCVPRTTPPNTTLIAALSTRGIGASLILDGATDTTAFVTCIEQVFVPTLHPGQIVLLDNLSAHKNSRVRAAIATRGCELWFLPTYSPDLSPIELAFAKIKAALWRAGAPTRAALEDAIATALDTITTADTQAFFKHCGYRIVPDWDQLLSTLL